MEQALLEEEAQEQEAAWAEVVAEVEWEARDLEQDQLVSVCVPLVELLLRIKLDCHAIK
jgi:hypothetical protein